jgi:hypothetical protein
MADCCANPPYSFGITTTTLYAYVNGDGSVKAAGQAIINQGEL